MRKLLLIASAMLTTAYTFAQSPTMSLVSRPQLHAINDPQQVLPIGPVQSHTSPAYSKTAKNGPTRGTYGSASYGTKIGSSFNIFGALLSEGHAIGFKTVGGQDIMYMIHRQNASNLTTADTASQTGYMEFDYSLDHGVTWDTTKNQVFVRTGTSATRPRYPSGDLFVGSATTWQNTYGVGTGPVTNGSTWVADWFGSMRMDTLNKHYKIAKYASTSAVEYEAPRVSTTASANYVWALAEHQNFNNATTLAVNGLGLWQGTFDATADTFIWTLKPLPLAILKDNSGNSYFAFANMTWRGKVGYVVSAYIDSVSTGSITNNHYTYHIWATTDEGANWTTSEVDPSSISGVTDSIKASSSGTSYLLPTNDEDIVIDGNGYLHIVTGYTGAASTNVDSLGYGWNANINGNSSYGYIYDVYNTDNGWAQHLVSAILASQANAQTTYTSATGSVGWGTRLQVSCDSASNKVFYTWLDDQSDQYNINPDIYVAAMDFTKKASFPPTNMTADGAEGTQFYWLYAAKNIYSHMVSGVQTYTIPAVVSFPISGTIAGSSYSVGSPYDADHPHAHYFVNGLNVYLPDFLAVNDIHTTVINNARVFPNPTTGNATLEFTALQNGNTTMNLTNVLGQTIHTQNINCVNGINRVSVNMTNLSSGIYFVTITSGNSKLVNKIVKD